MTFADRELADVFRNRDHPDWQFACDRIVQVFELFLSQGMQWPRLRSDSTVSEAVNGFWAYLVDERPRACASELIDGAGAVVEEAERFLRSKPAGSFSTGGMGFEERELADVFRDTDHPDWQSSRDWIVRIFKWLLPKGKHWPHFRGLANPDVSEAVNDFWSYLKYERPNACAAHLIEGAGAVAAEARRFLNSKPKGSVSIEAAESNLREHLRKKLKKVLRRSDDFQQPKRDWWRVPEARDTPADEQDLQRTRREQPTLAANWKPQNQIQDPPIARDEALVAHAAVVLRILNASCHTFYLRDLCWNALSPSFDEAMRAGLTADPTEPIATTEPNRTEQESGGHDHSSRSENQGRRDEFVDYRLQPTILDYVESLKPQDRSILQLKRVEGLTLRPIAEIVGMSKTAVSVHLRKMDGELIALFEERGYAADLDKEVWRSLRKLVRDVLESWTLPYEKERK